MKTNSATRENAISRRHFLLSASLATAAVGVIPLTGMKALALESPAWADDPGRLCLWYDRPAKAWMTEALPIGNGPMGAMLFGGTEIERVQFNEISLWAGARMAVEGLDDEGQDMGAYPVLKEVCQFWDDHLKRRPDGTLVTPDGWSPEHGPEEEGVTYDQEIIYDLFTNTIEAADVLGDDTEFRDHIAGLRDKLLKPKIGRWGQLQEWEADKDDPKDDHRHVSHLFALYPGRQITRAGTPELAEAARVSLQARGDASTGWSRAWKIKFWARLWDGDHAYTMLRSLLNVVRGTETIYGESGAGVYPNLFDSHPPFQIDGNFGATAGYCEMLVQSHAGRIHLLPALPKAWPSGKVTGLCARGGFEVDMSWNDGHLNQAVIHSKSGLPCKVVCGDQTWEFNTTAGKSYPLTLASKVNPRSVR